MKNRVFKVDSGSDSDDDALSSAMNSLTLCHSTPPRLGPGFLNSGRYYQAAEADECWNCYSRDHWRKDCPWGRRY
ncbi:hypothetical protein BCR33DRAFT_718967 [Rhizoclosmatium globosum]|uniref:CCHC-type domain-containing protein n=1 Tax=Rhizoclosmatium globosum TaxID=329046 RepID=A0A1Y2C333_9FUNG|nr:hypothetical protein BCR33DRAFT_718967 [Rhizoclosmatium globosum]|eukprot:ORY41356.1 hypothetical protein BCR33DRAFT_718967 [Rhizoclosmatium globosum]